jgi:hypothetical protein
MAEALAQPRSMRMGTPGYPLGSVRHRSRDGADDVPQPDAELVVPNDSAVWATTTGLQLQTPLSPTRTQQAISALPISSAASRATISSTCDPPPALHPSLVV